jgi:Fe-Mn family superoxide dismutase
MAHPFPDLPYPFDAFEPFISRETIEYHYGKHHRAYVDKLNKLVKGTQYENLALEEIVRRTSTDKAARENKAKRAILDNASQAWNHAFYWRCLTPHAGQTPDAVFAREIDTEFGSLDKLQKRFIEMALGFVGAGWAWLYARRDGSLDICTTSNAATLCASGHVPLLVCDVWEHAYYIDRRNDRAGYLAAFWQLANWKFAAANLARVDELRGETTRDERRDSLGQPVS